MCVYFLFQVCVYSYLLVCIRVCVCHTVLPQGWYNLGLLAEEGYRLPLSVLIELGLSELYLADSSLLLSTLYKRYVWIACVYTYIGCASAVYCLRHKPVRKIILYFLTKDAETQKIQIHTCLAALPSSMCIFDHSKRTIVLLLRLVWCAQATFIKRIISNTYLKVKVWCKMGHFRVYFIISVLLLYYYCWCIICK